ncbi:MAG: hypothetical protein U9Q74_02605 [Gemmatimonadota bacterium]|nr:hypothetical protein [Gemmatimonadota bacterium]
MNNRLMLAGTIVVILSACRDASPPVAATATPAGAEAARAAQTRRAVKPAEFHARNRMDWVGVAHNSAMDQLRSEIRRSKPKDLCRVIERVSDDAAAVPALGSVSPADRHAASRAAIERLGCRGGGNGHRNAASAARAQMPPARPAAQSSGGYSMSAEAWAVADQIQAAGGGATSADQLAGDLDAALAAAQGLSADDQAVLGALASVSLSSFEYWSANGPAMAQEIDDAYGTCIASGRGDACYYAMSLRASEVHPATVFQLAASVARQKACSIDTGFIWAGDKYGAAVGLSIGMMTRTVQGAIVGLIAGAAAGSGGASVYQLGQYVACAFK